jgi:Predicted signal transduction protein with a C-terminal ATPase domain
MPGFSLYARGSIRRKLVIGMLAVAVPTFLVLAFQSYYSTRLVRDQFSSSLTAALAADMGRIDDGFEEADRYLRSLMGSSSYLASMDAAKDDDEYYLAKVRLWSKLSSDIGRFRSVDAFFAYSESRRDFLQAFKEGESYAERSAMLGFLRDYSSSVIGYVPDGGPWRIQAIDGGYFLLRVFKSDGMLCGAWTKADNIAPSSASLGLDTGCLVALASADGTAMTGGGWLASRGLSLASDGASLRLAGASGYALLSSGSRSSPASLAAVLPNERITRSLPLLMWLGLAMSAACLALLPWALLAMRRNVFAPLERMVSSMEKIRSGDFDERIDPSLAPVEFETMSEAFNAMVSEIRALKIDVYEEKLDRQREEQLRLRAQMSPHFFLNALNTMYNMIEVKDYELTQEMILCLVDYFRYVVRNDEELVSLGSELENVRNYYRIHELRFPGRDSLAIRAPEFLLEALVPPLVVLTFVENTIKHASLPDRHCAVEVVVDHAESEAGEELRILVRDTGPGFPESALAALSGQSAPAGGAAQGESRKMGIRNVERRLVILYGDRASLRFSNGADGGARVDIRLPFELVALEAAR